VISSLSTPFVQLTPNNSLQGTAQELRSFSGQHDTEFSEQPAHAIAGCGALFDKSLAYTMKGEERLLLGAFHGHEAHVWPTHRFADRLGIVPSFWHAR